MIIYEYNGSDVASLPDERAKSVRDVWSICKTLAHKHNCDISEINVRFTE